MNRPIPTFLEGPRVLLRALDPTDADGPYPEWFNDADTCQGNSHHVFPLTRAGARAFAERAASARDSLTLAIVIREDGRHIGNVALQQIHPVYRSAEFSIMLGDKSAWGHGYASEAGRLICGHGFSALNLSRIGCGTFANNTAMQKLAAHLGMKEEGRRRQAAFKNGQYVDVVEFGVLRDEYLEHTRGR